MKHQARDQLKPPQTTIYELWNPGGNVYTGTGINSSFMEGHVSTIGKMTCNASVPPNVAYTAWNYFFARRNTATGAY